MSDSVRVNITAATGGFDAPMADATVAAQDFAKALEAAGGDLRKITPDMLNMGRAATTAAAATRQASAAVKQASFDYKSLIDANMRAGFAFKSAEESASVFARALNPAPVQRMKQALGEIEPASHGAHTGMAGITRELIVMGHEALQGRYSRIPGSMMVLGERSGFLLNAINNLASSFTLLGGVATAAVGAIVVSMVELILKAHDAEVALRGVYNAALLAGRGAAEAEAHARDLATGMSESGQIGHSAALKLAAGIESINGISQKTKEQLAQLGPALNMILGEKDVDKTVEAFQKMFSTTTGLRSFVEENNLLTGKAHADFLAAVKAEDLPAAAQLAMDGLNARIKPGWDAYVQQAKQAAEAQRQAIGMGAEGAAAAALGAGLAGGNIPNPLPPLRIPQLGTRAPDETQLRQNRAVEAGIASTNQLEATQRNLNLATERHTADVAKVAAAQEQLRTASDEAGQTAARAALESAQADEQASAAAIKHYQTEIQLHREMGDASWEQKQRAALDSILAKIAINAKSTKQLTQDTAQATIKFWQDVANQQGITEAQRTQAEANANRARLTLARSEVSGVDTAARQELRAKLSALSEEQAAYHDNFAKVMEIENQKIALLTAAGKKYTAELNNELKRRDDLERQHAQQVLQLAEQGLAKQREVDSQAIAERRSELDEEVTAHEISKAQEIAQLKAFTDEKRAEEIKSYEDLLATLDKETAAYKKLYDQLRLLKQQWATEDRRLTREATQDLQKQWESALAPIGSAFDQSISGVIQGTQTIQQAVARMAQSVVLSYVRMGVQAAGQWAASQLRQLVTTQATETAKTTATTTGAAARNAADGGGGFLTTIGTMLARWLGMETSKTGITTAAAGARSAAETASAGAAALTNKITALSQIQGEAAVAAAAAFADSAMLGPPGLAAAPGVAAATYAQVMGFAGAASLAVGAWDLPRDMPANLHAGEMVVPASFASGLRSALGGGSSTTLNYAPSVTGGGSDLASLLRGQAQSFKSYLWHATRNGALTVPGR